MNIAVLYRTHHISLNALPSVPRVFAVLITDLKKANPDFEFYIGCPAGEKFQGATLIDIGKGYTTNKIYQWKRRLYRKLKLGQPTGKVNINLVKKFFQKIPEPDIVICAKSSDIELAKKFAPLAKIIWWPLGIDTFNRSKMMNSIQLSDLIVFTGPVLYQYIFKLILPAAFPTPVMICHVPYDTSTMQEYYDKYSKQTARDSLGIVSDEIIMLHVGGNRPEKGFRVLEASLAMLPSTNKKYRLISIGHGKESITTLRNGIIIEKRGFCKIREMYLYYISADIGLVVPLWLEPGPTTFIEMLFFNISVVAAYNSGIPEMMGKTESAYSINEANDIIEWSIGIKTVLENEEMRINLTRNGRKRAIEFFNQPIIADWSRVIKTFGEK